MRMIYFIVTSSSLILLILFIRRLFRKKISPSVLYALWLIPYLRLLVPFGFVEVPMFGVAAEFLNRPFYVTDNSEIEYEKNEFDKMDVYSEYVLDENSNTNHNGTKVYASVSEAYKTVKEEVDLPGIALVGKADESKGAVNDIILTIWFLGVSTIGVYVIIQNRKLWKETNTLDVVGQIEGIDI